MFKNEPDLLTRKQCQDLLHISKSKMLDLIHKDLIPAHIIAGSFRIEKADLMQTARRRVKLGLLFNVLIEKHHLQVDETRVQQHIDQLANAFQFDQMVRDRFYKDKNMMMGIRSSVLEEQVIDKLLEEVEYTEKVAQYAEVMNLSRENHIANTEGATV